MEESKPEVMAEEGHKTMSWLQLLGEVRHTLKSSLGDPLPAEFWQHMHTSRKERLLALRTLLDEQIEHLDKQEEQSKQRKVTKITIQ